MYRKRKLYIVTNQIGMMTTKTQNKVCAQLNVYSNRMFTLFSYNKQLIQK